MRMPVHINDGVTLIKLRCSEGKGREKEILKTGWEGKQEWECGWQTQPPKYSETRDMKQCLLACEVSIQVFDTMNTSIVALLYSRRFINTPWNMVSSNVITIMNKIVLYVHSSGTKCWHSPQKTSMLIEIRLRMHPLLRSQIDMFTEWHQSCFPH